MALPGDSRTAEGRGRGRLIGLGVMAVVVTFVALTWWTRGELGMTWDEPYFFERQHEIGAWIGELLGTPQARATALSRAGLEGSWRFARAVPDQHPPVPELMSLVSGQLSGWLVGPLRSYRLATVLVFALAAATLVRLILPRWGPWAAVAALGTLVFNPRLFADAQQITADSDTGAFWFLAAVAYLRACETGRRFWLFGLCAGLAVMCKATGVLVVPALLLWALIHRPAGWWRPLVWSIPLVPAVMVAVMPPWWSNPVGGIARWVRVFLNYPQQVPVLYLGKVYDSVKTFLPWHNTIVLTTTMVPLGLLGLAAVGAAAGLRPTQGPREGAVAPDPPAPAFFPDHVVVSWATINFATWMVLRMVPGLPAHDGLRQLIPSFFFLPVLAGYGARWLANQTRPARAWAGRVAVVVAVATAGWETLRIHPYELSYYNALIGGPKGAKAAGMESTYFWDSANAEVIAWMNRNLPRASTVLIFPPPDVRTFAWEQHWGRLRNDLRFLNLDEPNFVERFKLMAGTQPCFFLFQMRQGLYLPREGEPTNPFVSLAEAPATYELVPPQVGIRLLALFDQDKFEKAFEAAAPPRLDPPPR